MKRFSLPIFETHPELAKEAHGWDPSTVSAGSNKNLEWICDNKHIWKTAPYNRSKSSGCPVCSNRRVQEGFNDLATTHPELAKEANGWDPTTVIAGTNKKLQWKCMKKHNWSASGNTRVTGVGCPVCSNQKLLVGYNDLATTHPELAKEADGWDPTTVIAGTHKKLKWICKKRHQWDAPGVGRKSGEGCPVCANKKLLVGYNDLATIHPEFAKEADGWDPTTVIAGTHKKLQWRCKSGHTWTAFGSDRGRGVGCPVCSNQKLLAGYNDLATTHPELAKEADGWDPTTVIAGTAKKLMWQCSLGHKWLSAGSSRANGTSCPSCASSGFDPNVPAYLYFLHQIEWRIYQIGITNVPDTRLKKHKRNGFEVYEIRGPMDGYLTREIEQSIIKFLRSKKVNLPSSNLQGKFDGYTESWTMESFQVNNLKELIDMASDAGF